MRTERVAELVLGDLEDRDSRGSQKIDEVGKIDVVVGDAIQLGAGNESAGDDGSLRGVELVLDGVERTKKYWPKLSDNIKKLILKDIQECIDRGGAGDDCDVREWNSLIEFSKGSNSTGLDRD